MDCFINGRSHFSIGESILLPSEVVKQAAEVGYKSVAITDTMNVNCLPELFNTAKECGIKPIIGARLRIVDNLFFTKEEKKANKAYFLRVIVNNQAGYQALLKLLSRANEESHFYAEARLLLSDVAELMGQAGEGACVVTLGDFYGAYQAGKAHEVVNTLRAAGVDVVSEVLPIGTPHFIRMAHDTFKMQDELGIPVVCGMPAFYSDANHADALDVMRAISSNMKMSERSTRHAYRDFVTHSSASIDEMAGAMTLRMADRYGETAPYWANKWDASFRASEGVSAGVSFEWHKLPPSLPKMAEDEFEALKRACVIGWKKRFSKPVFGHQPTDMQPYVERLKHELSVLRKMKFEAYFLLVAEITNWAKGQGIRAGAGRGSSAGSLVAYLMGVTEVDPIRFDLPFGRFINEERKGLPDADLDFMGTRKHEIVSHIYEQYGRSKTARIINYITLGAASTLSNICRTLATEEGMAFSKYVPKKHGLSASITEAINKSPELEKFASARPDIVDLALPLEDRLKHYGVHAAGVVVSDVSLNERAVVVQKEGEPVINWDMATCEDFGMVKVDILGLSTLDMIDVTLLQIRKNHGVSINMTDIPLNDREVLDSLGNGSVLGSFQVEGPVAKNMLMGMAENVPLTFDDIVAVNALNRPGPLEAGMDKTYIARKSGHEKVAYPHPAMERALSGTYGVICFQEDLMRLSQELCGFTGGEADALRKATGKKLPAEMAKMKEKFINGAVKGTITITLENGDSFTSHSNAKFKVKENSDIWTVEEIEAKGFELVFPF